MNFNTYFKQHYLHFHTYVHPHIYKIYSNNITETLIPNRLKTLRAITSARA